MTDAMLCKNCKHCKNERCVKFDFAADMREDNAWCKSGEEKYAETEH